VIAPVHRPFAPNIPNVAMLAGTLGMRLPSVPAIRGFFAIVASVYV
jgi:hypothetical protein